MAHRSHTETFVLMRNNATKKRYFYKEFETDDERANLVNGKSDANDIELTHTGDDPSMDSAVPEWVSNVDEFRYECLKINTKRMYSPLPLTACPLTSLSVHPVASLVDQLNAIQREHLKSKSASIFSEDSESAANQSYEIEIEFKCQEINKLFNRLHSLLSAMQVMSRLQPDSRLVRNVFQFQCKEIQDLTHKYRFCQNNYIIKCTENDKIDEQFDSEHLRARDQEMTAIVKSICELNQIFQDINTLVVTQGSVLDRIDYNVETVEHRVADGVLALSKAEKSMRSARKLKLILILSGFVILLFICTVSLSMALIITGGGSGDRTSRYTQYLNDNHRPIDSTHHTVCESGVDFFRAQGFFTTSRGADPLM
ncbi:unnamed protein product [Oppiella nova]|uniref:t-SNARE coiled-coil homology domain-containing protein n=1 Tax=Oppiella nova TaxID=334625 RepID=A0A7R9QBZ5_9ACAR|nr:unnamed protein product [Oppiella nova]CAG2161846.1 unnamed protein product [Oppiella nova]